MEGSSSDSGAPPEGLAEEAEPQGAAWSGDSGTVSQSRSSASGPWGDEGAEDGAPGRDLPLLRRAAACLLSRAGARPEVESLDASLEDLLTRLDEFVDMPDMLRGDSSQVVSQGVPRIHAKAAEMRHICSRIDRLEAFVRMAGGRVARMEEQVTKAQAELGAFPRAFKKLLHMMNVPALFSKSAPWRPQQAGYEAPVLFRTEHYFPCHQERPGWVRIPGGEVCHQPRVSVSRPSRVVVQTGGALLIRLKVQNLQFEDGTHVMLSRGAVRSHRLLAGGALIVPQFLSRLMR
nr:LOW QUALITY PROTEIN: biogenesis of lysosome-related organelles complex 1 subunit 4-like [Chlorocebus sabaeus]